MFNSVKELSKGFWTFFKTMTFTVFLKLLIFIASRVDLNFFQNMTSPKAILTLDAGDKLASRLKSCINGFLMFSSMTGWATFCGNDTKTSFLYTKMLIKPLLLEKESVWDNKNYLLWSTKSVTYLVLYLIQQNFVSNKSPAMPWKLLLHLHHSKYSHRFFPNAVHTNH